MSSSSRYPATDTATSIPFLTRASVPVQLSFLGALRPESGISANRSQYWVENWGDASGVFDVPGSRLHPCATKPVASDVGDRRLAQGRPAVWMFYTGGTWFGLLRVLYWVR